MLGKKLYVLISGKAGAGKTTVANKLVPILKEKFEGEQVGITNFALALKTCAVTFFCWDREKDDRGRKLLQEIGKLGRWYYEDVWVDFMLERTESQSGIILLDDWRFPNEANKLDSSGFLTYRINIEKPYALAITNEALASDTSETSLSAYEDFDYLLDNAPGEDNPEKLNKQLNEIANKMFLKYAKYIY